MSFIFLENVKKCLVKSVFHLYWSYKMYNLMGLRNTDINEMVLSLFGSVEME